MERLYITNGNTPMYILQAKKRLLYTKDNANVHALHIRRLLLLTKHTTPSTLWRREGRGWLGDAWGN